MADSLLPEATRKDDHMSFEGVVLTSAAMAAAVSGLMALIGQMWERKWRLREMMLAKAVEMAVRRTDVQFKNAGEGNAVPKDRIGDEVIHAATYYRWFETIIEGRALPDDAREVAEQTRSALEGRKDGK